MSGIKNLKKIALDSNIFIYNLEQNDRYSQYTDILFQDLFSKKRRAVTSIISLIEMLSYPNTGEIAKQIADDFYSITNLNIYEVDQNIAMEAAKIRRGYKFRLPDSIQLATALISKAQVFISNDINLKKFKELQVILLQEI